MRLFQPDGSNDDDYKFDQHVDHLVQDNQPAELDISALPGRTFALW